MHEHIFLITDDGALNVDDEDRMDVDDMIENAKVCCKVKFIEFVQINLYNFMCRLT